MDRQRWWWRAVVGMSVAASLLAACGQTEGSGVAVPVTSTTDRPTTASVAMTTVADGGSSTIAPPGAFTSPSGNIACNIGESSGVSCFIFDKDWEIERPPDPICEVSDWGNAIDLTVDGTAWSCYTDLAWDASAPPLPYGQVIQVGEFTCASETTGMSCRNGRGDGFDLARAGARIHQG
ncbi:MAG: DUF6636 domain-containing protein [Actinomycetota bacterium]